MCVHLIGLCFVRIRVFSGMNPQCGRINSVPDLVTADGSLVCSSWVATRMWSCVWLSVLLRVVM